MAVNEYDCAQDLLGRDVRMVRRTGNICVELWGRVICVRRSVPGEWFIGEIDVLVSTDADDGEPELFTLDLSKYCPEQISE